MLPSIKGLKGSRIGPYWKNTFHSHVANEFEITIDGTVETFTGIEWVADLNSNVDITCPSYGSQFESLAAAGSIDWAITPGGGEYNPYCDEDAVKDNTNYLLGQCRLI